jgi:hypothetical protein
VATSSSHRAALCRVSVYVLAVGWAASLHIIEEARCKQPLLCPCLFACAVCLELRTTPGSQDRNMSVVLLLEQHHDFGHIAVLHIVIRQQLSLLVCLFCCAAGLLPCFRLFLLSWSLCMVCCIKAALFPWFFCISGLDGAPGSFHVPHLPAVCLSRCRHLVQHV